MKFERVDTETVVGDSPLTRFMVAFKYSQIPIAEVKDWSEHYKTMTSAYATIQVWIKSNCPDVLGVVQKRGKLYIYNKYLLKKEGIDEPTRNYRKKAKSVFKG